MNIKTVRRNIPAERENQNDRFRVKYGNKGDFEILKVVITRMKTGEEFLYEFDSHNLTDKDSIHFTTSVVGNQMKVDWDDFISSKAR
ncbi:MAG: hypothetical protein H0V65_08025, partial [Chitinophagales bacterium]|nr:hypothetical protein [Chitinophagales bacterium]